MYIIRFFLGSVNEYTLRLDQSPGEVVHFVLDGFGGDAGEFAALFFPVEVAVFDVNGAVALDGTCAVEGETPFFRFVALRRVFDDFGVLHDDDFVPFGDGEDAFAFADHVRGEPGTVVLMCAQCVRKVNYDLTVIRNSFCRRTLQEDNVADNFFYHVYPLSKIDTAEDPAYNDTEDESARDFDPFVSHAFTQGGGC